MTRGVIRPHGRTMSRPKFQSSIAALACSFALVASANVPAQAGIFSFLGRHLFGSSHSSHSQKRKFVHQRSVHSVIVHRTPAQPTYSGQEYPSFSQPPYPSPFPFNDSGQASETNDQAFSTRASWYGPGFEGKRTASGEWFNQYGLTAASRTLPLGSKVLVASP